MPAPVSLLNKRLNAEEKMKFCLENSKETLRSLANTYEVYPLNIFPTYYWTIDNPYGLWHLTVALYPFPYLFFSSTGESIQKNSPFIKIPILSHNDSASLIE